MSAQILDVRLVQTRAGRWRVTLDGRRLALPETEGAAAALVALARALEERRAS